MSEVLATQKSKCVVNLQRLNELKFEDFEHGRYSGSSAGISDLFQTQRLGFHMETLPPKAFSCPYHSHQAEEELVIVFKGSAMVRQEAEFFEVNEGDLIVFKTGVAHQMYNHTESPFIFFALSNKDQADICEYPDSQKRLERATKVLTQNGNVVNDYWKDEEHPDRFWPKEIL